MQIIICMNSLAYVWRFPWLVCLPPVFVIMKISQYFQMRAHHVQKSVTTYITYKCQFFLTPYQSVSVNLRGFIIESSNCNKLLRIYIDINFSFEYHINRICRKATQKLHALSTIAKQISEDNEKDLNLSEFPNSTIVQQFGCATAEV